MKKIVNQLTLVELLIARFSVMLPIAAIKHQKNLPTCNPMIEQKILKRVIQFAIMEKREPKYTEQLFIHLISMSKNIQDGLRKKWAQQKVDNIENIFICYSECLSYLDNINLDYFYYKVYFSNGEFLLSHFLNLIPNFIAKLDCSIFEKISALTEEDVRIIERAILRIIPLTDLQSNTVPLLSVKLEKVYYS